MTQRDPDNVRLWRNLLAVAQAGHTVLETEIPEAQGVPARGMPILRLLRWHGPKTLDAIARFLSVSATEAGAIVATMADADLVTTRVADPPDDERTVALAPQGVLTLRKIITAQRERIAQAAERVEPSQLGAVCEGLSRLAIGLVSDSAEFGIPCAACWAHDPRECVRSESAATCPFLVAQRADLDPDPNECEHDVPVWCGEALADDAGFHSTTR